MLLSINPQHPEPRKVQRAIEIVRNGGVIAYPTDTVYGLGCDLHNKQAIERLYPDLVPRFVFCTGGVFTEASVHALAQRGVPTVAKPLDLRTVQDLVGRFASAEASGE